MKIQPRIKTDWEYFNEDINYLRKHISKNPDKNFMNGNLEWVIVYNVFPNIIEIQYIKIYHHHIHKYNIAEFRRMSNRELYEQLINSI